MEVVWTKFARDSLRETIAFIVRQWNSTVALKVRDSICHDVVLLERLPCLGRKREIAGLERFEVRRMIVDTRIKVYYMIYERKIYIMAVWDTRRNPEALEGMLRNCFGEMGDFSAK